MSNISTNQQHQEQQVQTLGILVQNNKFLDSKGRICLFRGINIGGSSKLPLYYHQSNNNSKQDEFYTKKVSFVNRPFPLAEAPKHFKQLKKWGFTLIRLIVTWEAIEHDGPGIYDVEYLTYIKSLIKLAKDYDLLFYIDPHQDVWSRWTGGDGAPLWTLECIGLLPQNFEMTMSATCLETSPVEKYTKMIWSTNYFKYACATMFTLFWGGEKLAPSCKVDGVNVQTYLQSHYINSMVELAKYLVGLENVIGFGTMNEPGTGYIGCLDLRRFRGIEIKCGYAPTAFQSMCLAEGMPQQIGYYSHGLRQHIFGQPDFTETISPKGRAYKKGFSCVWAKEGIWDIESKTLLKPYYFANFDFIRFYEPFAKKYRKEIGSVLPNKILFVELDPFSIEASTFPQFSSDFTNIVNASHWYDFMTLGTQTWRPYFTIDLLRKVPYFFYDQVYKVHCRQLKEIKEISKRKMNNAPTLIGETGIPFNLPSTNDSRNQIEALEHTISCLEENLLPYALWNYTIDNNDEFGDQWNNENLSIYTKEQGRAIKAFARPYAFRINGVPTKSIYHRLNGRYRLEYSSFNEKLPTLIYIPLFLINNYTIRLSNKGKYEIEAKEGYDIVYIYCGKGPQSCEILHQPKDSGWRLNYISSWNFLLVIVLSFFFMITCYKSFLI